jgi:deoxyribose-phosphate aldolase
MMTSRSPAQFIDHTLLKPDATMAEVARLCEEAVEYGFASVCVPPRFVSQSHQALYGSDVVVGTVIGFPLGYELSNVKVFQAIAALDAGAKEIDMVIPLGAACEGRLDEVQADIAEVVAAAAGTIVKVIIECCLLTDTLKRQLVESTVAGGAHYVKTSTGFAAHGATCEDVALLTDAAAGRIKVKAAGGIKDWLSCRAMLEAGAQRIGSSAGVAIMEQWQVWAGFT